MNYFKSIYKLYLYNKKLKSYRLWVDATDRDITSRFTNISIHSPAPQRCNKDLYLKYYIKGNIDSKVEVIIDKITEIVQMYPSLYELDILFKRYIKGTNKFIKID